MTPSESDFMTAEDNTLDGNAAAGMLGQMFAVDLTVGRVICASCSSAHPLATLKLYGLPMGAILRCPACNGWMIRAVTHGSDYWLDMRGVASLRATME